MDSHLTSQSSSVFRSVHSLIYIFDAESPDLLSSDTHYFLKCLGALKDQNAPTTSSDGTVSAGPTVFVLLHKMDLVPEHLQSGKLIEFEAEVRKRAVEKGWKGDLEFYGTSIWNETLYKVSFFLSFFLSLLTTPFFSQQAWSIVVAHLMPSLSSLRSHLSHFLEVTSASEVVLFERTTFLVISSVTAPGFGEESANDWDKRRFERISTMVKAFKLGCSFVFLPFLSLSFSHAFLIHPSTLLLDLK